jgi:DNA-binding MarR family transcriptional regulator
MALGLPVALWALVPMHKVKIKSPKAEARSAVGDKSPEDIARTLKLDKGLGFLVRLLDARFKTLYEQLTAQSDITPRQFGVLLTLHQQGTLTLTDLARYIRVDRSTLGEIISRMEERCLITRRSNGSDRRSAEISLAAVGKNALLKIVVSVVRNCKKRYLRHWRPTDRSSCGA